MAAPRKKSVQKRGQAAARTPPSTPRNTKNVRRSASPENLPTPIRGRDGPPARSTRASIPSSLGPPAGLRIPIACPWTKCPAKTAHQHDGDLQYYLPHARNRVHYLGHADASTGTPTLTHVNAIVSQQPVSQEEEEVPTQGGSEVAVENEAEVKGVGEEWNGFSNPDMEAVTQERDSGEQAASSGEMDEVQPTDVTEEPLARGHSLPTTNQSGMIFRVDEAEKDTNFIDSLPEQSGGDPMVNESTADPIQTLMTSAPSSPPTAHAEPETPQQILAEVPQDLESPTGPGVDSGDLGPPSKVMLSPFTSHMQPTSVNVYAEILGLTEQQYEPSPSNDLADMLGLTNFAMFGGISVDPSPSPHLPLSSNNGPVELCNDPECPIDGEHPTGMYLHKGEMPHTFNSEFGYSDPPPEVWYAWARIEELRGGEAEIAMVNGFAKCHWWNGG